MTNIEHIRKRKILIHIFIWAFLFCIILWSEYLDKSEKIEPSTLFKYLDAFIGYIFTCYFNLYFLIPLFFKKKKYVSYVLMLILCVLCVSFINYVIHHILVTSDFVLRFENKPIQYIIHIASGNFFIILASLFFYFVNESIELQEIKLKYNETNKEKAIAELNTLKAQINPHFLFNSLNNIYSLSLEKSEKSPETILKLSDLLSYVLYDCKAEKVFIEKEIEFIQNYLDLEKQRFGDQLSIDFRVSNQAKEIQIAPLLFIPLIENAFKHGGNRGNHQTVVKINFYITNQDITFSIWNTTDNQTDKNDDKLGGIGIENVRKRLDLLYPSNYSFEIESCENEFKVNLKIIPNGNKVHHNRR